jgi:hypothetical protein
MSLERTADEDRSSPAAAPVSHAPTTPWERGFTDLVGVAGIAWLAHERVVTGTAALGALLLLLLPTAAIRMIARALGTRLTAAASTDTPSEHGDRPAERAPLEPRASAPAAAAAPVRVAVAQPDRAPHAEVIASARREERA